MFDIGYVIYIQDLFFKCEFDHDVILVIKLVQFGNFWELVHMYMHSAPIFNMDPTAMVKMQSSATIYSVGMIQTSMFNLISTMVFFM